MASFGFNPMPNISLGDMENIFDIENELALISDEDKAGKCVASPVISKETVINKFMLDSLVGNTEKPKPQQPQRPIQAQRPVQTAQRTIPQAPIKKEPAIVEKPIQPRVVGGSQTTIPPTTSKPAANIKPDVSEEELLRRIQQAKEAERLEKERLERLARLKEEAEAAEREAELIRQKREAQQRKLEEERKLREIEEAAQRQAREKLERERLIEERRRQIEEEERQRIIAEEAARAEVRRKLEEEARSRAAKEREQQEAEERIKRKLEAQKQKELEEALKKEKIRLILEQRKKQEEEARRKQIEAAKKKEPTPVAKEYDAYEKYSKLDIEALYTEIRGFLKKHNVEKKVVDIRILEDEFGKANIKKLIVKSYLISIGKGVTVGK